MKEERFEKNSVIIRQGEIGDKFYVIAEGRANIIHSAFPRWAPTKGMVPNTSATPRASHSMK